MIGGNRVATIQVREARTNSIGEHIEAWTALQTITGWLDVISNSDTDTPSKTVTSTHVFISDYVKLNKSITKVNSRMVIDDEIYIINYIDDPMGLKLQLEIYLERVES